MHVSPYLHFNGQCEEAFKFYEKSLGGKISAIMRYGESPMATQVPPEWKNRVLHVHMQVGDMGLMASDTAPGMYAKPQGFRVSIDTPDPAEADRIFNALAEGGSIQMPIQKTFWAERFGMLVDRFDTPWMINCSLQQQ